MAELAIRMITNPKAANELKQCGDIIVVVPDGHKWEPAARLPKFLIAKIPGTVEEVLKYIDREFGEVDFEKVMLREIWDKNKILMPEMGLFSESTTWMNATLSIDFMGFIRKPSEKIDSILSKDYVRLEGKRLDALRNIWKFDIDKSYTEQDVLDIQNRDDFIIETVKITDLYNKITQVYDK